MPTVRAVFEDRGTFQRVQGDGLEATPRILNEPYSGIGAVWVPADGEFRLRFESSIAIRGRPDWNEFRFIRFAYRKQDSGDVSLELNHAAVEQQPTRYVAGDGPADGPAAPLFAG